MMLDNEREVNQEASDEARRRANEALRQEQVPADEMNATAQTGNGAQPDDAAAQSSPESKIEMGTTTAETIKNFQAETINNTNTTAVYNLLIDSKTWRRGFIVEGVPFGPLATGKERFKPAERKPEDVELP